MPLKQIDCQICADFIGYEGHPSHTGDEKIDAQVDYELKYHRHLRVETCIANLSVKTAELQLEINKLKGTQQ